MGKERPLKKEFSVNPISQYNRNHLNRRGYLYYRHDWNHYHVNQEQSIQLCPAINNVYLWHFCDCYKLLSSNAKILPFAATPPAPDENEVCWVLDDWYDPDCHTFDQQIVENLPADEPVPFRGPKVEISVPIERVQKCRIHDDGRQAHAHEDINRKFQGLIMK